MPRNGSPFDAMLKKSGLRRTPVRLAILDLLAESGQPLGVPEILSRLAAGTDIVTIYRTLNTFSESKIVHRIRAEDRSWRYAFGESEKQTAHTHPHFVCDECGKVECLADAAVPSNLVPSLRINRKYTVRFPEVILHGVCPKCR